MVTVSCCALVCVSEGGNGAYLSERSCSTVYITIAPAMAEQIRDLWKNVMQGLTILRGITRLGRAREASLTLIIFRVNQTLNFPSNESRGILCLHKFDIEL